MVAGLVLVAWFGFKILGMAVEGQVSQRFGISLSEPSQSNVTSTQVICGTATTSLLVAQSGRTSFMAQNQGTSTAYLCRATNTCSSTTGIAI